MRTANSKPSQVERAPTRGPAAQVKEPGAAAIVGVAPGPLSRSQVVALQRVAGNRAVVAAIRSATTPPRGPVVQRTIGGYPTVAAAANAVAKKLGRPVTDWTSREKEIVKGLHQDLQNTYSVDQAVRFLQARADPRFTSGPVTVVNQATDDPFQTGKTDINLSTGSQAMYEGEKAQATFEAFIDLQNPLPGTKVGFLQTLRFSRRSLVINGKKNPAFDMANCRDGAEPDAPWMVRPVDAVGRPVLVKMNDEPGQWAVKGGGTVSATGADLFSTWLVATTVERPTRVEDVQILYHWDWQINWAAKSCSVTGAGPGQGSHSPVLIGEGARKRYNDFLRGLSGGSPTSGYQTAIAQLREGLKGPNLETSVDPKLLSEIVDNMRTAWNSMSPDERKSLRKDTLKVLDEYMMRVQRRRPAQANLGQELGFKSLAA